MSDIAYRYRLQLKLPRAVRRSESVPTPRGLERGATADGGRLARVPCPESSVRGRRVRSSFFLTSWHLGLIWGARESHTRLALRTWLQTTVYRAVLKVSSVRDSETHRHRDSRRPNQRMPQCGVARVVASCSRIHRASPRRTRSIAHRHSTHSRRRCRSSDPT